MNGYLLDVNILIALLDNVHEHHVIAAEWMEGNHQQGWASCPITQNGCIRIMSQGHYRRGRFSADNVAEKLKKATSTHYHSFIPDNISLLDSGNIDWGKIQDHNHITDVYLLALARHNGCRLVTLDQSMNTSAFHAISGDTLEVLGKS